MKTAGYHSRCLFFLRSTPHKEVWPIPSVNNSAVGAFQVYMVLALIRHTSGRAISGGENDAVVKLKHSTRWRVGEDKADFCLVSFWHCVRWLGRYVDIVWREREGGEDGNGEQRGG